MRKFVTIIPALIVLLVVASVIAITPSFMDRYAMAQQGARIKIARNVLAEDDILRRIDRAISAIADSVEPTVVHIEAHSGDRDEHPSSAFSSGAGWIYDSRGFVITNAHVVKTAEEVSVEFSNGRKIDGTVVGSDIYTDIAVVKIDSLYTTYASMRSP